MIQINKSPIPPKILLENKDLWTRELMDNILQFNSFAKIPKEIKDRMWQNYRHPDIKEALFQASHNKCAFCESKPAESGNIEIEHFKPKSLYPQLAFAWENLLPVCRKCNESKSSWDTEKEPIINPTEENPEERLTYNYLEIKPIDPEDIIARRTIEVCNLNSWRLCSARSELLLSLTSYKQRVEETLKDIETAENERKRINKINKLRDSLDIFSGLLQNNAKYAGYTRCFLSRCESYQKALMVIQENSVTVKEVKIKYGREQEI